MPPPRDGAPRRAHCLWYRSLHTRTVRVLLVRETDKNANKPLLALVTTDLTTPAERLVSRYASRWGIEVTFTEAREHLGAGQAQSRTRRAVEHTVPFALYCYTITVIWYTLHGHHPSDAVNHPGSVARSGCVRIHPVRPRAARGRWQSRAA
ncbi:transposase [Streptomyces sp. WM6378]|uniref:transposase n=1 Tax=Streptomyces sp. WM6378 TaxID=1415557 RepID=UPI000D14A015